MATMATWTQNSRLKEARGTPHAAIARQGVKHS